MELVSALGILLRSSLFRGTDFEKLAKRLTIINVVLRVFIIDQILDSISNTANVKCTTQAGESHLL